MHYVSPWIDEAVAEAEPHIERFITTQLVPKAEAWDKAKQVDRESWLLAADAGLLCASIPEAYGGAGASMAYELMIQQELARAGIAGSFGICQSIHLIVAHYILAYGTEEQKQRWLPAMARAELIGAIAMTEPGAGSDLQGIRTRGERVEGGWRLSGQKTFISNGQTATLILVVTRTADGPGSSAISLLAVETDGAEGFSRGRNLEKIGLHGQDTSELFFDNVFVPNANVLGGEAGSGFSYLMQQLPFERMLIALNAMVGMERAVELALEYTRDRTAFGKAIFDFQNTQFVLANAKSEAVVARTFVDALLVRLLAGELDAVTAAMAKMWTSETASRLIDACLQLFGGYGYMMEYPIARLFADSRASRIYGGSNEIMKLVIARSL